MSPNEAVEVLLVEDNPNDVELTLRALKKHNLANQVHVAKDGAEALDFLFGTGAWAELRPALSGEYDETVWDHLAGPTSAPVEAGDHGQVAVKVVDDRGNELLVVKSLRDATA